MKQAVIEARRKPESEPEVVEEELFAPVEEIREEKAEEIAEPVKAEVKEDTLWLRSRKRGLQKS